MKPTAEDFQAALDRVFRTAEEDGRSYVEVVSGNLHERLGGYPGRNHRMPVCCHVMNRNKRPGDEILESPPSGQGATLIIRYQLPR